MKKIIVLFVLFPIFALSQKIQIKKDKVIVNNVEAAILNEPFRNHYEYLSLANAKKFSVDFKLLNVNQTEFYQWLEVSNADGTIKTEIPHEVLVTAFDVKKVITHLLSVKYKLIDEKGINEAELAKFFEVKRESLSDKYGKIVASSKIDADEQKKKVQLVKSTYNPQIQKDKTITFSSYGKLTVVGRLVANPYVVGNGSQKCLFIYDLDNILVASLTTTSMFDTNKIETFDGKTYDYYSKSVYSDSNSTYLYEFLCDLISRGYTLGHQAKIEGDKLNQAKIKLAKEKSVNIYKKAGYVIDEDGKRIDGIISINFQMLDINNSGNVLPEQTADNYGKIVSIKYLNEKKQERTKTFKANSKIQFCITEAETPMFFYGMPVKGDSMKKLQNMSNLSFDNSYFYQLVHKENSIMVLQDPVETERLVVKILTEDKGQMIDKRNNDDLNLALSDYLKSCKSVSTDIKSNQFDLKILSNLITIAKEYQNCK